MNHVKLDGNQKEKSYSATDQGDRLFQQKDQTGPVMSVDNLVTKYYDLFQGIGKLKGVQFKLHIDDQVQLIAQKQRRVPCHIMTSTVYL